MLLRVLLLVLLLLLLLLISRCPGPQLWSKPLPGGKVAVLVLNTGKNPVSFKLPLVDVPKLSCGGGSGGSGGGGGGGGGGACKVNVRNVWKQTYSTFSADHIQVEILLSCVLAPVLACS